MMNLNLTTTYNSRLRILSHVTFWLSYWLYHSLIYGSYEQNYTLHFQWEGLNLPVKMAAAYFTLYVLLPRYFLNRKYLRFVLILAGSLIFAACLQRVLDYVIIYRLLEPESLQQSFFSAAPVMKIIIGIYPVVALAAFIKLAKYWYKRDLDTQQLEKEKLEAELKFLKGQIHPHFLFNTLNNLYALTLKKSEQASEVVLKLSELLSYMLYEGNVWKIPLEKELEVIKTYISLEKIRYGDRLQVVFNVEGETDNIEIPPMLILPFIENTFKHGTSGQAEQVRVNIYLEVTNNEFILKVENSKSDNQPETVTGNGYKEGIGLKNVQRRLELLYGRRYDLQLKNGEDLFTVLLKLKLDYPLKTEEL